MFPDSLANIAKDWFGHPNPFSALPGFCSGRYACKWGLTDLYPEDEKILREAIENRRIFDTGWAGCQKEIRSFRIISDGKVITIMANADMDEFDDLIYDVMDTEVELTEEQLETLHELWVDSPEMSTYAESEKTVPVTTYEDAMEILSNLEDANETQLKEWSNVVKSWVKEVTGT